MDVHVRIKLTADDVDVIAKAVVRMLREEGLVATPDLPAAAPETTMLSEESQLKIPESGFLRLPEVLKLIPVGKTVWYQGIQEGRFPAGIKLSERCTAWRAEDIKALIEKMRMGER